MNQFRDSYDGDEEDDDDEFDSLRDFLEGQDGSGPPLWDPAPNEVLIGTFLRFETRYSPKIGSDCKVAIIQEPSGGLHSVWLTRSVLASSYERLSPREGDRMGHKYHGLQKPRGGGPEYHNYTVTLKRRDDRGGGAARGVPVAPGGPSSRPEDEELPF
jgi:hypothetical protein